MKYNWSKVPGLTEVYTRLRRNSQKYLDKEELSEVMDMFEDFIISCFNKKYITNVNYKEVLERLNNLEAIRYIHNLDNKTGYTSIKRDVICIKRGLSKDLKRISLYKELAKVTTSVNFSDVRDTISDDYILLDKDKEEMYEQYGWKVIEDAIVQEIAENLYFDTTKTNRGEIETVIDNEMFGKKVSFESNFLDHKVYQALLISVMNILYNEENKEKLLDNICKKAFKGQIKFNDIREYLKQIDEKNIMNMIIKIGIIGNRQATINEEDLFCDRTITQKEARKSYDFVEKVISSRSIHKK